ncbi:MAG: hypothetical protein OMM_14691 [Candidatus Magnetoglobus multicellularis str. Araruama]|uniref:Uncharacterized protein n=1 Tax=Candidatus Magnetoglobus multicellularis str. Araruama TaxID=890399 RepID=A0A1V1NRI1_9BACT|nr:MAG: hypothetical protein OMM_14691 [Candidatus Magnetoglobus multicellularis str. Araruama]
MKMNFASPIRWIRPGQSDITYDVNLKFYLDEQPDNPIRSYTITFIDYATIESKRLNKSSEQTAFETSFEDTIETETKTNVEFYPLAAIDTGFVGSEFSQEYSFTVNHLPVPGNDGLITATSAGLTR